MVSSESGSGVSLPWLGDWCWWVVPLLDGATFKGGIDMEGQPQAKSDRAKDAASQSAL